MEEDQILSLIQNRAVWGGPENKIFGINATKPGKNSHFQVFIELGFFRGALPDRIIINLYARLQKCISPTTTIVTAFAGSGSEIDLARKLNMKIIGFVFINKIL